MTKTNAIRMLESSGYSFKTKEYVFDENNLDAVHVADEIGVSPECVFKTLVTIGDKGSVFVFCIPANFELDLKKAAKCSGNKNIEMIKVKDLFDITGYIRGGCSPVGMKKKYPVIIDETAQLHELIYVSAGVRGEQIIISPDDLLKATSGVYCDIIR